VQRTRGLITSEAAAELSLPSQSWRSSSAICSLRASNSAFPVLHADCSRSAHGHSWIISTVTDAVRAVAHSRPTRLLMAKLIFEPDQPSVGSCSAVLSVSACKQAALCLIRTILSFILFSRAPEKLNHRLAIFSFPLPQVHMSRPDQRHSIPHSRHV